MIILYSSLNRYNKIAIVVIQCCMCTKLWMIAGFVVSRLHINSNSSWIINWNEWSLRKKSNSISEKQFSILWTFFAFTVLCTLAFQVHYPIQTCIYVPLIYVKTSHTFPSSCVSFNKQYDDADLKLPCRQNYLWQ